MMQGQAYKLSGIAQLTEILKGFFSDQTESEKAFNGSVM